jgi:nitrite reductase (NADH) small subunit
VRRDDAPTSPRVVHLDRRVANAVEVGEDLYMFLDAGDPALVAARCPHRGGPLHFATLEERAQGAVLVCPWHGTPVPLRALKRRAVATVQSGHRVRAVIDAPAGAEPIVRHIPIRFAAGGACTDGCGGDEEGGSPPS